MANQLATAATHGGVISRAISNGKRFSGGRYISSTSSSHVTLDKLSATKILQCAFAGKIQPPPRPERIDADADELCMTADCDYYGRARPNPGAHGPRPTREGPNASGSGEGKDSRRIRLPSGKVILEGIPPT